MRRPASERCSTSFAPVISNDVGHAVPQEAALTGTAAQLGGRSEGQGGRRPAREHVLGHPGTSRRESARESRDGLSDLAVEDAAQRRWLGAPLHRRVGKLRHSEGRIYLGCVAVSEQPGGRKARSPPSGAPWTGCTQVADGVAGCRPAGRSAGSERLQHYIDSSHFLPPDGAHPPGGRFMGSDPAHPSKES